MASSRRIVFPTCAALLCALSIFVATLYGGNDVLGEIELVGATKVEKTSGVWIDGQYVGYLKELKGSKNVCYYRESTRLWSAGHEHWIDCSLRG